MAIVIILVFASVEATDQCNLIQNRRGCLRKGFGGEFWGEFWVRVHRSRTVMENIPKEKRKTQNRASGLRVGTYNVHSWKDASYKQNGKRVAKTIKEADLDIVSL